MIAGIDVSSFNIDLVLLHDDTDHATWHRIPLQGATPFDRARSLRLRIPSRSWLEDHGIWLAGIEDPHSRASHTAKALGLATGALVALLPAQLPILSMPPAEWKRSFTGTGSADKHTVRSHAISRGFAPIGATADAYDAYGIAWAARAINQQAIQKGAA